MYFYDFNNNPITDSLEWNCYCAAGLAYVSLVRSKNDDDALLKKVIDYILR